MGPDPQKVSAVHDWVTPTDPAHLRSFLGLASYYHRAGGTARVGQVLTRAIF